MPYLQWGFVVACYGLCEELQACQLPLIRILLHSALFITPQSCNMACRTLLSDDDRYYWGDPQKCHCHTKVCTEFLISRHH